MRFSPEPAPGYDGAAACDSAYAEGLTFCVDFDVASQIAVSGAGFAVDSGTVLTVLDSEVYRDDSGGGFFETTRGEQGPVYRRLVFSGREGVPIERVDDPSAVLLYEELDYTSDAGSSVCASLVESIESVAPDDWPLIARRREHPTALTPTEEYGGRTENGYLLAGVYLTSIIPRPGVHLDGGPAEYVATWTYSPVEILAARFGRTLFGWSPHLDVEMVFDEPVRIGGGVHGALYLLDWSRRGARPAIYTEASITGGGRGGLGQVVGGGLLFGWSPIYSIGVIARRTWTQNEDPWTTISLSILNVRYPVGPESYEFVW